MTSKRELLRRQRRWAASAGLRVDSRGYLESVEANLFAPLSPQAREAFERGSGAELRGRGASPAKLRALHSSAALAVNVFDHWTLRDAAPLLESLDIASRLRSLRFEAQFETGLPGSPPNLDVALELESGTVVGIESKFTEWLTPKRASRPPFKDKYFERGARRWADCGLPECQALAADIMSGRRIFRRLDAAQLLKHALGLATQRPGRFALRYLYFEIACPAAARHGQEIARFTQRVGAELGFEAGSYQALVESLSRQAAVDAAYLRNLRARYAFSA